ncbi:hypothetical protein EON66_01155 [archaeon]|nr:MAG: hypothetical protein EON66_01155 [archaeon]
MQTNQLAPHASLHIMLSMRTALLAAATSSLAVASTFHIYGAADCAGEPVISRTFSGASAGAFGANNHVHAMRTSAPSSPRALVSALLQTAVAWHTASTTRRIPTPSRATQTTRAAILFSMQAQRVAVARRRKARLQRTRALKAMPPDLSVLCAPPATLHPQWTLASWRLQWRA